MHHIREEIAVSMAGMAKRYGPHIACEGVDLTLHCGEVHALLGDQGAGKTTLMRMLMGHVKPDAGDIYIGGQPKRPRGPREALALGVGMIGPMPALVPSMTVLENAVPGAEPVRCAAFVHWRQAAQRAKELLSTYALSAELTARAGDLSGGAWLHAQLLRLLFHDVDVLILDEPMKGLPPQEMIRLARVMERLTAQGKAVFLLTSRIREVMECADTCTVLKHGKTVGVYPVQETPEADLEAAMWDHPATPLPARKSFARGSTLLEVRNLTVRGAKGVREVNDLSLRVRAGEIMGIAGMQGSGRTALYETLAGLRRPASGRVFLADREVTGLSMGGMLAAGLCVIPQEIGQGIAPSLTGMENLLLARDPSFGAEGGEIPDHAAFRTHAMDVADAFGLREESLRYPAALLSCAEAQKLIVARALLAGPKVLIAMHPNFGLDEADTALVRCALLDLRAQGCALLLFSEELEELLALSDRIAVLHAGRFVRETEAGLADAYSLGLNMAGGGLEDG